MYYLKDVDTTGWRTGERLDFENYRNTRIKEIQSLLRDLTATAEGLPVRTSWQQP